MKIIDVSGKDDDQLGNEIGDHVTPIIDGADKWSLSLIAAEYAAVATAVSAARLEPHKYPDLDSILDRAALVFERTFGLRLVASGGEGESATAD